MATSPKESPTGAKSKSKAPLSEYLHHQFEAVISHNSIKSPKQKIEVVQRINDFLQNPTEGHRSQDDMFSPIISDVHLIMRNGNGSKNRGNANGDDERAPRNIKNTPTNTTSISSIQLPVIDWHQHFRKGYSMLMWVRFHSPNSTSSPSSSQTGDSKSVLDSEPQILYRFATSDTPMALGLQATLYRDTSKPPNGKNIPSILRVETLRPPVPSNKIDSAIYNSSLTTPIAIPEGKWTLIGIQHSHPYLKPPLMNIAINGEEVYRDELAYPALGSESGFVMRDNILLSNLPSADPVADSARNNTSSYESSHLNIEMVDFAGFGLFNDNIPIVIQGIISEHGPCYSADGVIPSAPPGVQNRDAVVVSGERNAMQKKRGRGMSGPFGHRAEVAVGRGVGIPLCTGVMLSSDGKYQGEILLQKLLSKLVIGLNASQAVMTGGRRVVIPVTVGCSIGLLGESNTIGLVQPKEPFMNSGAAGAGKKGKKRAAVEHHEEVFNVAKFGGDVSFYNATQEYLKVEEKKESLISIEIPSYNIPSSLVSESTPIPSFLNTYSSLDAIGYILQAFRLALPPPGYIHNLQMDFYHDSFDHLYDLLVYRGGAFAAQLIELFAATLSLGGRTREGILHSGSLHVLVTLLRRVLLRASRLGMFLSKNAKSNEERLWKIYSPREDPGDELLDIHATKQSAPDHIPVLITKACCSIVAACCGPTEEEGSRWKRSSLALHIRRASDIALTAIFGFAFDIDIWGNDLCSCAAIMKEVVDRYCTDGFDSCASTEVTEKFDNSHGRILRFEISIQSLLDIIRTRFGEEMILSTDQEPNVQDAQKSLATSLSRLLYTMLKYSLSSSKTVSQGEDDVTSGISALSDCLLGSIGSHAILMALKDVLIYCETFPALAFQSTASKQTDESVIDSDDYAVSAILFNHTSRQRKEASNDHCLRLKRMKTGMEERLAKYLILGQFHDVVAPLLLSRTIFDGRREVSNSDATHTLDINDKDNVLENTKELNISDFHWQEHWRLVLYLFTWVTSVSGSEGSKAAKATGNLMLHSGKAGSLYRCLVTKHRSDVLKILVPPFPTATSALSPGSSSSRNPVENHINDLSLRLKSFIHLIGGLTAGLLSYEHLPFDQETIDTIATLVNGLKVVTKNILKNNHILVSRQHSENKRHRRNAMNGGMTDQPDIEAALELVPPIVIAIVLFEEKIEKLRRIERSSDSDSWDLVEEGSNESDPLVDEQMGVLRNCQESLSNLVGLLIAKAMIVGGGEVSTVIWRAIISSFDTALSTSGNEQIFDDSAPIQDKDKQSSARTKCESSLLIRNNLLCRLAAIVLNLIIYRHRPKTSNPWTTMELCSATARLCDLVEEKKLLEFPSSNGAQDMSHNGRNRTLTLDQVLLLCALLDITKTGRENTGWCQLILPNPPSQPSNFDQKNDAQDHASIGNYHSLLDAFEEERKCMSSNQYFDHQVLSDKDEIYDITVNSGSQLSDLDQGSKPLTESLYPESITSSKMLLPILQPTLRVVLDCLGFVRGAAVVVHQKDSEDPTKQTDSLLSIVVDELSSTITAAIVGLAFSNARDVCLNTLSALRKGIRLKDDENDGVVATQYHTLFLNATNEMRIRYVGERSKRKVVKQANEGNETEAANSNQVEILLMGNSLTAAQKHADQQDEHKSLIDQHDNEDFITFPHDQDLESEMNSFSSPRGSATLGWNNYKGFGKALEQCCTDMGEQNVHEKSDAAFSLLSSYLHAWDERQLIEDEESELLELFDTKTSLENRYGSNPRDVILSYNTAADSMTSFIELASVEGNRKTEMQSSFLPTRRYNCVSFTENLCWKIIMERTHSRNFDINNFFERCMADGSRDYGGRLISIPTHPQFPRIVPKQLDHSEVVTSSHEIDDDNEIDFDQLNSLVKQGTLKIVDITKKENKDELAIEVDSMDGSQVIVSKPSMDSESLLEDFIQSEELFLGFPDTHDGDDRNEISMSGEDKIQPKETISIDIPPLNEQGNLSGADDNQHHFSISTFSNPPNVSSSSLQGHHHSQYAHIPNTPLSVPIRAVDLHYDNCLHIKAEGNRNGTIFFTATTLVFEYDDVNGLYEGEEFAISELAKKLENDEEDHDTETNDIDYERIIQHFKKTAAQRPQSMRWNITQLSHIYLRRYRLRDSALEMFFIPSGGDATGGPGLSSALSSILLDFGSGNEGNRRRDEAANAIMSRAPESTVKQWPDKSAQFLHEHLRNITIGWVKGRVSNFDYLLALNCLSGRSFNDLCQYPVFPWVLSDYTSEEMPDLEDKKNYRDLTKPMGAINPERLKEFVERFQTFDDPVIPSFMYGSHYSTSAGVVLHFLVRLHPFASLHRQLQGGHFDVADRLFSSVSRSWDMCTGQSAAEVKELTPEWYCNPSFLRNSNNFKLGTSQDGDIIGDVELPPWAKGSPEKFVEVLRCALESDVCTSMLPDWIDLIFGRKQQGQEAVEANNVFFYLTYYGSCDVASIEDEDLRIATELQIAHFGQCPMQLFWRPHVQKLSRSSASRRLSLSEMLGVYDLEKLNTNSSSNRQLPFESAPISHWVHLFAPPPGPHAPLISVRFIFPDRCLAIDAQGIFHFFRWAWRSDTDQEENRKPFREYDLFSDQGHFVAQRELPHFRSVPRLPFSHPKPSNWKNRSNFAVVAISKCLFAGRSLLVVSDGDRKGGLCLQMVDPSKCVVQGEVFIRSAHSSQITAIHMESIGTASGVGGVGGELTLVGSHDGTASLWRFISNASCHLPIRPRLRFGGHRGRKIHSVAINGSLNLCATVSASRCCIFNASNGGMLRSIAPPNNDMTGMTGTGGSDIICETRFVDSNAICITSSGFIILVCESKFRSKTNNFNRVIVTLQLFTLEGAHMGSKALESWRGIPNKIAATYDGRAVMVCSGRGISIHLVSAIKPLHFIDEWHIGGDEEDVVSAHDIDFGPSPSRPVVAVTGLSSGALRIHALKGIGEWSDENKKGTVTEAVGSVIGTVKGTGSKMVGLVRGTGSKVLGLGKEIGREAIEGRGVTGFLGDVFGKKMNP